MQLNGFKNSVYQVFLSKSILMICLEFISANIKKIKILNVNHFVYWLTK